MLTQLEKSAAEIPAHYGAGNNHAKDTLAVARTVLEAQIAMAERNVTESFALLDDAVRKEDHLAYGEPSAWFFPVRHILGAQLLKAGKAG